MKQLEAMIAWTPSSYGDKDTRGQIEIGTWPDRTRWSDPYAFTIGACMMEYHEMTPADRIAQLFIDFHTCVVRDGISPQDAHREFLKIDEYRAHISPEIPGADPG